MEAKDCLDYSLVRMECAVHVLPMLVDKTLEILRQGHSLPGVGEMGGVQDYCADLAVSYADALVGRLKRG